VNEIRLRTAEKQELPAHLPASGIPAREPCPAQAVPHLESQERWYAAYTEARHEKKIAHQLEAREISCFLPCYRSLRRWKDRKKLVELPLFPSYVFVHLALKDRLRVLQLPGVVQLVGARGLPEAIPDCELNSLRQGLAGKLPMEPHPYLTAGRRVRVIRGAVAGLEGILLRRKQQFRFVLSIELLQRSVALEVDEADLEPLP
jgi:transcription antitermination factor NusG